jgi:hypothetical protein
LGNVAMQSPAFELKKKSKLPRVGGSLGLWWPEYEVLLFLLAPSSMGMRIRRISYYFNWYTTRSAVWITGLMFHCSNWQNRWVAIYSPSSLMSNCHCSSLPFVFAVSVLLVLCFSMGKNWKNVRMEIKCWIFLENGEMTLIFYTVFMEKEQWIGHRFLCELSDRKMGVTTLLALKDPAIFQLKELSECGTRECGGIKGLEDGRRSKYG